MTIATAIHSQMRPKTKLWFARKTPMPIITARAATIPINIPKNVSQVFINSVPLILLVPLGRNRCVAAQQAQVPYRIQPYKNRLLR
jgi:hypothetical protein